MTANNMGNIISLFCDIVISFSIKLLVLIILLNFLKVDYLEIY